MRSSFTLLKRWSSTTPTTPAVPAALTKDEIRLITENKKAQMQLKKAKFSIRSKNLFVATTLLSFISFVYYTSIAKMRNHDDLTEIIELEKLESKK